MGYSTNNPIQFESVSQTTLTNSVELGRRTTDSSGNEYIYVYNAGEYQIIPGRTAYLLSNTSGYSITATNTASQVGLFAGGVHHATIATAYYGWIMTRGLAAVSPDTSAVSFDEGEYLAVGVNDGYVDAGGATFSTGARIGFCISSGVCNEGATFAGDLGKGWIKSDIW